MPYIKPDNREDLQQGLTLPRTPGELNFVITELCVEFLDDKHRYTDINEVMGVLECAKFEFYRRVAAPYENIACATNGDVYR